MELKDVYVFTTGVDCYSAQIKVTQHFKYYEQGGFVKTEVFSPQGEVVGSAEHFCKEEECVLYFDLEEAQLWYPRPYGEQPLYTLRITVGEQVTEQSFGIRTVKVMQLPDKDPAIIAKCKALQKTESGQEWDFNERFSGFILLVNGIRIYCTGGNWVPCEPFPSAETDEKISRILEKAVAGGINMIRVWGGGIFEKEHFYKECDRLGIMVTQDFLMACGHYPEEDKEFPEQIKKEAEFAAIYLRNHPALVWWSGDNENAIKGDDKQPDYWGRVVARQIIAPILDQLDYNRQFLLSSPYGGKTYASKTVGTTHDTQFDTWKYIKTEEDLSGYREHWREYTARFIAEEPNMGAVCRQSMLEFLSEDNLHNDELWLHHCKTNSWDGKELLDDVTLFAKKLFGDFKDFEDRYFKLRYIQYEWVRITLGNARSNAWFNSGIIYWMLNDCWPASAGWALIDYYLRPKAGYYAIQSHGQPVASYLVKGEEGFEVYVSNILNTQVECGLSVYVLDLSSRTRSQLLEETKFVECGSSLHKLSLSLGEQEVLIAEVKNASFFQRSWYKEGTPKLVRAEAVHWFVEDDKIEVWADDYIHVVEIENTEYLSDNYFSLVPGERRQINYKGTKEQLTLLAYTFL